MFVLFTTLLVQDTRSWTRCDKKVLQKNTHPHTHWKLRTVASMQSGKLFRTARIFQPGNFQTHSENLC